MNSLETGRWMLALAKAGLAGSGESGTTSKTVPAEESEWDQLYDLSYDHGLVPLVRAGLQALKIDPPAAMAAKLAKHSRGARLRSIQAADQFREIAEAFAKEEIEVIALKGILFAFRRYAEPGLRNFKDIDILVRVSDLDRAGAVLDRLGYRSLDANEADRPSFFVETPVKYHCGYERGDEFPVELHWDLVPKRSPVRFDLAGLWERSLPWEGWGAAREMSFEDETVFLATHMARHEFLFPARALFDLGLLVNQNLPVYAHRLWQRAADCNAAIDLAAALGVAEKLGLAELPVELADRVAQTASANRLDIAHLARYALTWPKFEYAERAIDVLTAPGFVPAVRRLGEVLFPKYKSLVEREERHSVPSAGPDVAIKQSYSALWRKRLKHWAAKAMHLPDETANLRVGVQMRRAFNNRTVREDD